MKKNLNLIILTVFLVIFLNLGYRFINGISPFSPAYKNMTEDEKIKMFDKLKEIKKNEK